MKTTKKTLLFFFFLLSPSLIFSQPGTDRYPAHPQFYQNKGDSADFRPPPPPDDRPMPTPRFLRDRRIIVGGDSNYPPFSFLDKQGAPQGHEIEVMNLLASQLGFKVEYRLKQWSEVMQDLDSGAIDAIVGIIFLEERKRHFDFTIPICYESYYIFTGKGAKFDNYDDLYNGKIAAVEDDASITRFINPMNLEDKTVLFKTYPDAFRDIEEGKNDFVIAPYSLGMQVIKDNKYKNITAAGEPILPSSYCIAVRRGNPGLLEFLNGAIDSLKSSGTIETINKKWLIQPRKETTFVDFLKYLWLALTPIIVALAILFAWSWSLRRRVKRRTAELSAANEELYKALAEVKQLSGFIPICASCKKIRDDKGYWNQIETYISQHSEAQFSHGICPDCMKKLYPELADIEDEQQ